MINRYRLDPVVRSARQPVRPPAIPEDVTAGLDLGADNTPTPQPAPNFAQIARPRNVAAAADSSSAPATPFTTPAATGASAFVPRAISLTAGLPLNLVGGLNEQLSYFSNEYRPNIEGVFSASIHGVPLSLGIAGRNFIPGVGRLHETLSEGRDAMRTGQASYNFSEFSLSLAMNGLSPQINIPSFMGDPNGRGASLYFGLPHDLTRVGLEFFIGQGSGGGATLNTQTMFGARILDQFTSALSNLTFQTPTFNGNHRIAVTLSPLPNSRFSLFTSQGAELSGGRYESYFLQNAASAGPELSVSYLFNQNAPAAHRTFTGADFTRSLVITALGTVGTMQSSMAAADWAVLPPAQPGSLATFWGLGAINMGLAGAQLGSVLANLQYSFRNSTNLAQRITLAGAAGLVVAVPGLFSTSSNWDAAAPTRSANGGDLLFVPALTTAGLAIATTPIPEGGWRYAALGSMIGGGAIAALVGFGNMPSSFLDQPVSAETPRLREAFIANGGSAGEERQLRSAYTLIGSGVGVAMLGLTLLGLPRDNSRTSATNPAATPAATNSTATARVSGVNCSVNSQGANCGISGTF